MHVKAALSIVLVGFAATALGVPVHTTTRTSYPHNDPTPISSRASIGYMDSVMSTPISKLNLGKRTVVTSTSHATTTITVYRAVHTT